MEVCPSPSNENYSLLVTLPHSIPLPFLALSQCVIIPLPLTESTKKAWNTGHPPGSASDAEQRVEGTCIVAEMNYRMQVSALWFWFFLQSGDKTFLPSEFFKDEVCVWVCTCDCTYDHYTQDTIICLHAFAYVYRHNIWISASLCCGTWKMHHNMKVIISLLLLWLPHQPQTSILRAYVTSVRDLWAPGSGDVNSNSCTRGSVNPTGNPTPAGKGNSARCKDSLIPSTV